MSYFAPVFHNPNAGYSSKTSALGDYQEEVFPCLQRAILVQPSTSTSSSDFEAPRIVKTVGICGGDSRVAHTRIPVWGLEAARRIGCSDGELIEMYPPISKQDLDAVWDYVASHSDEIEQQIRENEV